MNVCHIATIAAFELKAGGFRGVYKALGEEAVNSEPFDTLEKAKYWAKMEAWTRHRTAPGYSLAAVRMCGEYRANVWVNA